MPSIDATDAERHEGGVRRRWLGGRLRDAAGWVASLVTHGVLVALLAALSFPPPPGVDTPSLVVEPRTLEALDAEAPPVDLSAELELSTPLEPLEPAETAAAADLAPAPGLADPAGASLPSVTLAPSVAAAPIEASPLDTLGVGVAGRADESRRALVEAKGGSPASEAAVARGLKWIVEHQNSDGSWSLIHSAGSCRGRCGNDARLANERNPVAASLRSGTALALLPLLGAGETHRSGRYRTAVDRGLRALVQMGRPYDEAPGVSWMDSGRMYSHGIAAIALTEAYGLTRDPDLRAPAQAAIDFLAYAQHPEGGGWRYSPQTIGDVSVTGWQIMALKSAQLAELRTPPRVAARARRFLDATSHKEGARYAYLPPLEGEPESKPKRTLTAVGLLCRMYTGWSSDDPRLLRGLEWMVGDGPSRGNYYRNYYVAQALFHQTGGEGPAWNAWNESMRQQLVRQQETRGHERGSWWVKGPYNGRGGRLYTTALATMTLEVYYRYLPIYRSEAITTDFPD